MEKENADAGEKMKADHCAVHPFDVQKSLAKR